MDKQYQIPRFYMAMAQRIDALAASVPGHAIAGRPVDNELAEIGAMLAILKAYASARMACGVVR